MKVILLLAMVLGAPLNLRAAPGYREEVCTLKIEGRRFAFFGQTEESVFLVQRLDDTLDLSAMYVASSNNSRPAANEDLVVQVLRENSKRKKKFNDGCYRGLTGSFRREVRVAQVSARARELLKAEKDQTLRLDCTWQAITSDDRCSDPGQL